MPREATGNEYESRGRWYARITVETGKRHSFVLPTCEDKPAAVARRVVLAGIAATVRGKVSRDMVERLLVRAAEAPEGKKLVALQKTAEALARGKELEAPPAAVTFRDVAERWLSGEIAREYPDRVRELKDTKSVRSILENHIYSRGIGDLPLASFTIDHGEDVLRHIPAARESTTRQRIAGVMVRVLSLATYPLRVLAANPLPKGFVPAQRADKAKGWLYPAEDKRLLACVTVPYEMRLFYGFLHREGPRPNEAIRFDIADVDLERGAITLDKNKTNDPRTWALGADVVRALRASIARRVKALGRKLRPDEPLFVGKDGQRIRVILLAERYRTNLRRAGIDRPELFETTDARRQIRLHDARATFVTINLANGKTETWISDRTGHKSSKMIHLYRRAARMAAELGLGPLAPLDESIPELAAPEGPKGGKGGGKGSAAGAEGAAPSKKQRKNKPEMRVQAAGAELSSPGIHSRAGVQARISGISWDIL